MSIAQDTLREIEQKRAELKNLFDMGKTQKVDPVTKEFIYDASRVTPEEVQRREQELAGLEQKYQIAHMAEVKQENDQRLEELYAPQYKSRPIGPTQQAHYSPEGKLMSIGQRFASSMEYKGRGSNPKGHCSLALDDYDPRDFLSPELKTLFVSANMAGEHQRLPGWVPFATRPIRVPDVIPQDTTEAAFIDYFRQTGSAHTAATTVSESGAKPEATIEATLITSRLEVIAAWIPVTKQAVDDVPQLTSLIEMDLRNAVQNEEEDQILNGNNVSPQIQGFLTAGIQSQNRGADNNVDAIYKAFTLVRWTGFAEPSAVVINPNNWQTIRLMKNSNNDYIWGPPSLPGPETVWGKPIVVTNAIALGTALTGDFVTYSQLWRKRGIQVDIADQHASYFVTNMLAIRAEERVALAIKRLAAFSSVINLN